MTSRYPSRWPAEDGGPRRHQVPCSGRGPHFVPGGVEVRSRLALGATMVVLRDPGEVFLLTHTAGPAAVARVERIDAVTLEPRAASPDLPGGPAWPGGIAVHGDGALHVVFGNHAHRLDPHLRVEAAVELPRRAPYNSFVTLPDGHLVTKDFGGPLPGADPEAHAPPPAELCVLDPVTLAIVDRCALPEASVARLSADGATVYAVGVTSLWRVHWDGSRLRIDPDFAPRYRTRPGQTWGWDAVLALGAAWFLDDGAGAERYDGALTGRGVSTAPLQLVRVDLASGAVTAAEVCGRPGGLVANPPAVDESRRIAVGYDSGNAVMTAFDVGTDGSLTVRWRRDQAHGCHPLLYPDTGELVTNDHDPGRGTDQVVVLDVATGSERVRIDSGSPVQSVLFPAPGFGDDCYLCSFTTLTRVARAPGL